MGIICNHLVIALVMVQLFLSGPSCASKMMPMSANVLHQSIGKAENAGNISVLVAVPMGLKYLDRKKLSGMSRNASVLELKRHLEATFPGYPPVVLQRIFWRSRLLDNDELLGDICNTTTLTLTLDLLSGTSGYNRTGAIAETVDALISTQVHMAVNGAAILQNISPSNISTEDSLSACIALYRRLNASFYAQYAKEIERALLEERNPESASEDTMPWRRKGDRIKYSALSLYLAKEFNLHMNSIKPILSNAFLMTVSKTLTVVCKIILKAV